MALGGLWLGAAVICDPELFASEQRRRHRGEVDSVGLALGHPEYPNAVTYLAIAQVLGLQNLLDAPVQRGEVIVEQAGLETVQKLLGGQEGKQLIGLEPEPRQLVFSFRRRVVVTIACFVILDRGVEEESHGFDDALRGGP